LKFVDVKNKSNFPRLVFLLFS